MHNIPACRSATSPSGRARSWRRPTTLHDRHRRLGGARGAAASRHRHRAGRRADRQPLQSVVARNVDPLEAAVVSICMFQAGNTDNVIPQTAQLRGTARSLIARGAGSGRRAHARDGRGHGGAYGAKADGHLPPRLSGARSITQQRPSSPPRSRARSRARQGRHRRAAGDGGGGFLVHAEARPGAFIFVGNGDSAGLHHPAYNFNDDVIPIGTSYWVRLVETALPA